MEEKLQKAWYGTVAVWRLKRASKVVFGLFVLGLSLSTSAHGQQVGDLCVYQTVVSNANTPSNYPVFLDTEEKTTFKNHPIHRLLEETRPGVFLDAHSKALLRMQPDSQLLLMKGDSTYFVKPGFNAIHLATEGRVRRTNLIPDSLFKSPEERYLYGYQVAFDTFFGKLPAYVEESSRVLGIWRIFINETGKIAVLVSNDHLRRTHRSFPPFSIAIFSQGLVFEDLIRFDVGSGPFRSWVPHVEKGGILVWEMDSSASKHSTDQQFSRLKQASGTSGREVVLGTRIQIAVEPYKNTNCVPNDDAVQNKRGTEEWPKQRQ